MLSVLREHQHEIADLDGANTFLFGTEETGYLTLSRPQVEGGDARTGEKDRSQEDGQQPGRDYRNGKAVVFEVGVLTDKDNYPFAGLDPYRTNLDFLDTMEAYWYDPRWRSTAAKWMVLRSHEAGVTRRCYGRPRAFTPVTGRLTPVGYSAVVASFVMFDPNWYEDTEEAVTVGLVAGYQGGLVAPLVAPLSTTAASEESTVAVVGGSTSAWPVVEFHGPVSNPSVVIGGIKVGLTGSVPADEVIVYDPQPWVRRAYRLSDGAGVGGIISAETPLMKHTKVPPGTHEVTYRGTDPTGTTTCSVRWRSTRTRV